MPGLAGGDLHQQLAELRPRTRVLLLSADGEGALPKPFSQDALARAVRQALDRGPR
jgi:FixJ family two-component response regulator